MPEQLYNLFPEIQPFQFGTFETGSHHVYYEQCGNPDGMPVVFLHGGPGSGCNATQRRFFDPSHYRIILLDQRGCGRSTPLGSVENNTIDYLVDDLESLRKLLSIEKWIVFGGSWGSTLALAYAAKHSSHVLGLILRGIFLSRTSELSWFLSDVNQFFPEAFQKLVNFLPSDERAELLAAYSRRIFSHDSDINVAAATNWNAYESSIMSLQPSTSTNTSSPVPGEVQVARARVQIHYIENECFVGKRSLLEEAQGFNHIPTIVIQGRYDMVCPPISAWELSQAMPNAELHMIADAGHSAMEPGITSALVAATERFKTLA